MRRHARTVWRRKHAVQNYKIVYKLAPAAQHGRQRQASARQGAHCGRPGAGWDGGTAAQPCGQRSQLPQPGPHPGRAGASQLRPRLCPPLPSPADPRRWQTRAAPPPAGRCSWCVSASVTCRRCLLVLMHAVPAQLHASSAGTVTSSPRQGAHRRGGPVDIHGHRATSVRGGCSGRAIWPPGCTPIRCRALLSLSRRVWRWCSQWRICTAGRSSSSLRLGDEQQRVGEGLQAVQAGLRLRGCLLRQHLHPS